MRGKEVKFVVVMVLIVLLFIYVKREDLNLNLNLNRNRNLNRNCECQLSGENKVIEITTDNTKSLMTSQRPTSEMTLQQPKSVMTSQQPKSTETVKYVHLIPKRIHQIYKDENIPEPYHDHIATWVKNHPDWDYHFWTDHDAETMISERYPQFISLYKNYTYPLSKSDVIRYFILHQYGGVYADLDMRSIKPIGGFLDNHTNIISPEPTVQTNLIFNLDKSLTNCIMASVPNHPFSMQVLNNLHRSFRTIKDNLDVLHSTGPFFLNKTYEEYMSDHKSCKGKFCDVFVPNHTFLVPKFDVPDLKHNVNFICVKRDIGMMQRNACDHLVNTNYANPLPAEAVTDHYWLHLGWKNVKEKNNAEGKTFKYKHIRELVPNYISYNSHK